MFIKKIVFGQFRKMLKLIDQHNDNQVILRQGWSSTHKRFFSLFLSHSRWKSVEKISHRYIVAWLSREPLFWDEYGLSHKYYFYIITLRHSSWFVGIPTVYACMLYSQEKNSNKKIISNWSKLSRTIIRKGKKTFSNSSLIGHWLWKTYSSIVMKRSSFG